MRLWWCANTPNALIMKYLDPEEVKAIGNSERTARRLRKVPESMTDHNAAGPPGKTDLP